MTQFKQGHEKRGGRKKGVTNLAGRDAKILLLNFLNEKLQPEELAEMWDNLKHSERSQFIIKALQYVIPKQQSHELDSSITPEVAKEILNSLIDEHDNQ